PAATTVAGAAARCATADLAIGRTDHRPRSSIARYACRAYARPSRSRRHHHRRHPWHARSEAHGNHRTRRGGMKAVSALIRRDLGVAMRQGSSLGTAIGFFLAVVMLLPIGLGPDQALMQRIAPGALWIALLLSVLLSADRIFQIDYDDGSLEVMTTGAAPLALVALAKSMAHWLATALPLA